MPLFDNWHALWRTALTTTLLFSILIVLVRLTGKRVTAHMNNFDWIVTVAVGALMAKTILVEKVTLAEGSVTIATLLLLQWAATWAAARSRVARRTLLAQPTLLYYEDAFQEDALRRERVTRQEVQAEVRSAGYGSMEEVAAVILEPNGEVSTLGHEALAGSQGELVGEMRGAAPPYK